jgi:filamentous hemagglutinin
MPPGKVTAPGPDFITYSAKEKSIVVWDAKYRGPAGSYPRSIPQSKIERWVSEVKLAVEGMPEGGAKIAAQKAIERGAIRGQIFRWPQ